MNKTQYLATRDTSPQQKTFNSEVLFGLQMYAHSKQQEKKKTKIFLIKITKCRVLSHKTIEELREFLFHMMEFSGHIGTNS